LSRPTVGIVSLKFLPKGYATFFSISTPFEINSVETDGGDFVAVGTVYDTLKIARLDENGNAIWNRLIRGPQGSSAFGLCIAQTNDSGFIVGGFTYQGLYLVKTYAGGDTVWTKIIEDGYKAYSIKQDTGDGYVVVGSAGQHSYLLRLGPQPFYICGDVYADGAINLLDIQFLVNFIYYSGPDPEHIESANVNCDARVNMLDVLYLIAFIYENGPAPCCEECCL
jgi:hypothetical protein